MRNWTAISGGIAWSIVAALLVVAALQPVAVSAAGGSISFVSLCPDGSPALAMGCDSIHL